MRRHHAKWLISIVVFVVCFGAGLRFLSMRRHAPIAVTPSVPDVGARCAPFFEKHRILIAEAENHWASADARAAPRERGPTQGNSDDAQVISDFPRTHFDLTAIFLDSPDSVSARMLIRHEVLNCRDQSLDSERILALDRIVVRWSCALRELYENYRGARNAEMAELARAGRVAPYSRSVPEGAEALLAQLIWDRPDLRAGCGQSSFEALRQVLRDNWPPDESYTMVDGSYYRFRDFGALETDVMYGQITFFAGEFLFEVCAYFSALGLADDARLAAVVKRAQEFTALERRRSCR